MKVPSRRSKLEIYLDILHIIAGGESKPTRIMYAANLSWLPMRMILKSLKDQGLIQSSPSGNRDKRLSERFDVTEKGHKVLKYFHDAGGLIEVPGASDRRQLLG